MTLAAKQLMGSEKVWGRMMVRTSTSVQSLVKIELRTSIKVKFGSVCSPIWKRIDVSKLTVYIVTTRYLQSDETKSWL